MTQPIWYDSTETGAPTLNNVAGSLLDVLRACLIDGFNEKTVTSITVVDEVATVACTGHGFSDAYGKLVLISGATEPLLNGNKQPGDVLTNSFTFPAPGVADDTYTGTLSAKRAPLGWTEPYTGTNVAMFARSVPEATAMLLRVDDSVGGVARVRMVESATDIDTFTGPAPTDAQVSGGGYWQKFNAGTANGWVVVGNDRGVWVCTRTEASPERYAYYFFGDGVPYYAGDAYFCVLTSQSTTFWTTGPILPCRTAASYATAPTGDTGVFTSRGLSTSESEVSAVGGPNTGGVAYGGDSLQAASFDNVAIYGGLHVIGASKVVRGELPAIHAPLAIAPFSARVVVTSSDGATYVPIPFDIGQICLRISGEWY